MKKRAVKILIGVVFIIVIFIAVVPFIMFHLDNVIERKELNNAIIDSGFKGWYTVYLDDERDIKIPEGWTLKTGERLSLYDDTGKQIAFGTRIDGYPSNDEVLSFLSEHYGDTVASFETGESERIKDTEDCWIDIDYSFVSGKKRKLMYVEYWIKSSIDPCSYVLFFEEYDDNLHEIATAMIYSDKDWQY